MRWPIIRAVVIGGVIGILLSLAFASFGQRLTFDSWQRLSPHPISTDNVAVILIDDESVAEAGAWPWPRYQMAQLVELIGKMEPAAIGLDIFFVEPDPASPEEFALIYPQELDPAMRERILALPNMDDVFAEVIGSRPVVMARGALTIDEQSEEENAARLGVDANTIFFGSEVGGTPPPDTLAASRAFTSIYKLDSVAMGHGVVNGAPDDDGIVRRVPLSVQMGETLAPGFAAELVRIGSEIGSGAGSGSGSGVEGLIWQGRHLTLGNAALPADEGGNMAFKMARFQDVPQYTAIQLFRGEISPETLRGKTVLVGLGATGTYDIVETALQSEVNGVMVQAMAVDAMIEGAWLDRPNWAVLLEWALAAALWAVVFAIGLGNRSWLIWAVAGCVIALPLASWLAYTQGNVLIDPVRPLLIFLTAAIALSLTRYALARAERSRLAHELIEERVAASEQKGELEAARRIQMSMVPGPKALSRLDPRTEIAGVLEPAKSVGGDFFDAVKINDNLLLFLVADVTGKGVPAALFMALSKTLSKSNLARAGDGLEAAIAALNFDLMDEADEEMGLTMLAGTIDCATGACRLINAGHENPMIARADGSVETFAMRGGPPLCVIDFPYQAEAIDLDAGDTLVIITDGATEAANANKQLFGLKGVTGALGSQRDISAEERAHTLAKAVRDFEGESDPSDDLTIFTLRYVGANA